MRSWSKKTLKQAIPIAEELKQKLLKQYALEHEAYLKEKVNQTCTNFLLLFFYNI